jgi:hypothetical protein
MFLSQRLVGPDNLVKISIHNLIYNVYIIEIVSPRRSNNILDANHLFKKKKL